MSDSPQEEPIFADDPLDADPMIGKGMDESTPGNQDAQSEQPLVPPAALDLISGVRQEVARQEQQEQPRQPGFLRRVTGSLTGIFRKRPDEQPTDQPETSREASILPGGETVPYAYVFEPEDELEQPFERLLSEEAEADQARDLLEADSQTPPALPDDDLPGVNPPDADNLPHSQSSLTAQLSPFALEEDSSDDIYAQQVFESDDADGGEEDGPEWLPRGTASLKTERGPNVDTHILASSEEEAGPQPVFLPDDEAPESGLTEPEYGLHDLRSGLAGPKSGLTEPEYGLNDLRSGIAEPEYRLEEPEFGPHPEGETAEEPGFSMPALDSPFDVRAGLTLPDDDDEPPQPLPPAPAAAPEEAPTKNLRTFFTGILRPGEMKKKTGSEDDLDDRVVTDRLNASLGTGQLSEPSGSSRIRRGARTGATGPLLEPNRDPVLPQEDDDGSEDVLWTGIGTRVKPQERRLTGEVSVSPFIGEDEPDERKPVAALSDGQSTLAARLAAMGDPSDSDGSAAEWEGSGVRTGRTLSTTPDVPMDEMRSMVLEEYDEEAADRLPQEIMLDREGYPIAEPGPRRSWWSTLSRLERFLLILFVAVAIAVTGGLVYMFNRPAPPPPPVVTRPSGEQVSGAPMPSGIKLTGGWFFPLERNTIVDGKWKPVAAEWLEGSEVRRVIAIPWNAQTEAVIQTYVKGDEFELYFDNNDLLVYTVNEVKRVPVGDVSIFQDRRPTLAVVLYQEESEERWVVVCSPK